MKYERVGSVPSGTFQGHNFMTPYHVAYYRLESGQYVEVSRSHSGEGISGKQARGVTIKPDPLNQSTLVFGGLPEVEEYLESLEVPE